MKRLLNKNLGYSITPTKFNATQLDVDFRRFERTMRWIEVLAELPMPTKKSIFKNKKHNLPKQKASKELQNFYMQLDPKILGQI